MYIYKPTRACVAHGQITSSSVWLAETLRHKYPTNDSSSFLRWQQSLFFSSMFLFYQDTDRPETGYNIKLGPHMQVAQIWYEKVWLGLLTIRSESRRKTIIFVLLQHVMCLPSEKWNMGVFKKKNCVTESRAVHSRYDFSWINNPLNFDRLKH